MAISFTPITFKNTIDGGPNLDTNFSRVETAFTEALSRTSSTNNEMQVDLDMNGNRILNVATPLNSTDVARLADVQAAVAGGSANLISFSPTAPYTEDNVQAAIEAIQFITTATGTDQQLEAAVNDRVIFKDNITQLANMDISLLEDKQPVAVTQSGRAGLFYWQTGDQSANVTADTRQGVWVAPTSAPTGASGAWQRNIDYAEGAISVEWFGTVGDGVTDDGPAFQAAIAYASDGDVIYVPAPATSYLINTALTVDKRIHIVGNGAQIDTTTAVAGVFNMDTPNSSLRGLYIQGNRTAGQKAVRVSADYVKVRDMDIQDTDVAIEVWGGVWHRIEHIRAENIVTTVLIVGNVVGTVVEDFRYDTRGGESEPTTGIYLFGEGCNFSDLDFINAGTACHITTSSRSSTWNFFNSCSFDTSDYGLYINNTDAAEEVKGIMFDHCWFSSHRNQGVWLDGNFNTDGISFSDCYIINNQMGGMFVEQASTNVEVKDCVFAGNSQATASTYPSLKHNSVGRLSVTGSNFGTWGNLSTNVSAAIERSAGASYLIIDGCTANSSGCDAGLVDGAPANPLSLGHNYGLFTSMTKQRMKVLFQSGSTDASGDITFAHGMPDAWTAIAQMDPASGNQIGVRSVDSTNVVMRVTNLGSGAPVASTGPWNITVAIFTQEYT